MYQIYKKLQENYMQKKLLKNKNFMLLIIGNFVSLIGSNIQQFILSLYVLSITGSATLFASMLAVSILPRLLLSPIAGVFGDWFDKKKAIITLDLVNATVLFSFSAYLLFYNDLSILLIYVLVIILEVTEIFFGSSMSAVLPSVVDKDQYLEANSMRTVLVSFGQLMAPIIGALLYASFGIMIILAINAASFLISAITEMFLKIPKINTNKDKKTVKHFKKDFLAGIKIIKDSKAIKTIISIVLIINFSIAPLFSVGMIFLLKEVLKQSDMRLGLLQVVISISMILSPILLAKKIKHSKLGDVLMKSFLIMGLLVVLIAFAFNSYLMTINDGTLTYILILAISFLIGVTATIVNISVQTLFQKIVPLEYMGRTSTVMGLFATIAIPLGQMLFGYLYDIMNAEFVIIINGLIIIITVFIYKGSMHYIDQENAWHTNKETNKNGEIAYEV
jgi:MFS family permease